MGTSNGNRFNSATPTDTETSYGFDYYQEDTSTTAIYPEAGSGTIDAILYTVLGLIGEAGEVANKWKKFYRDTEGSEEDFKRAVDSLKPEVGDVLWYLSQLCTELGIKLSDVATDNIRKLTARQSTGTLGGSGDYR